MFSVLMVIFLISSSKGMTRRLGDGHVQEAIVLQVTSNSSRENCTWKMDTDSCSKSLIKYTLHTKNTDSSEVSSKYDVVKSADIDMNSPAWLHSSSWNPSHETVILVHGYGGVADYLPTGILRDAYLANGNYNVIVVDWGSLAKLPCYVSAVHNIKYAARCLARLFTFLRQSGTDLQKTTCVGHSLGAHVCGITSNYLTFRMHKIIGIDPAKPLIPNGLKSRLDAGDADMVQVLHTSSNYGDLKKMGHVDFYFNGGRIQPYCVNVTNEELCSHARSVCYLAESIFPEFVRHGTKCKRRIVMIDDNPRGILHRNGNAHFLPVGQSMPDGAIGTYCVSNIEAPYCSNEKNTKGSPYCCRPSPSFMPPLLNNFEDLQEEKFSQKAL